MKRFIQMVLVTLSFAAMAIFMYLMHLMVPFGTVAARMATIEEQRCTIASRSEYVSYYSFGATAEYGSLVMLHGRGVNSSQFFQRAEQLAAQGYRVVLVDLPGHGKSPLPSIFQGELWTLSALSGVVHDVVTNCAGVDMYALYGHSLGGVIALEHVSRYADEVSHLVVEGAHLEIVTVPESKITLDRKVRGMLGNTGLYSAFMAVVWCDSRAVYQALREVYAYGGGYNVARDMAIIRQIPRYDYRSTLEQYERQGGRVSLVVADGDRPINADLTESLAFMNASTDRQVVHVAGGHYGGLLQPIASEGNAVLHELLHPMSAPRKAQEVLN